MPEAKTLVERLKQIDEEAMYHLPATTHATIAEAITALEAAQKALEPFAALADMAGNLHDESLHLSTLANLRLARTVHNMLKGTCADAVDKSPPIHSDIQEGG